MHLRTGVDLIEIERIRRALAQHGARFLDRVYTDGELRCCGGRVESLAARFAAKEAVAKALGTGVWRDGVAWTDIEVLKDAAGAPQLCLYGGAAVAAARLSITTWSISLSHNRTQAIAFVVGVYT